MYQLVFYLQGPLPPARSCWPVSCVVSVARISGRAVELTISVPESLQENFVKNSCSFFLLAILVGRVGERAGEKSMSILKNKNVHVKWRVIPFFLHRSDALEPLASRQRQCHLVASRQSLGRAYNV